jgi:hypothetical protein
MPMGLLVPVGLKGYFSNITPNFSEVSSKVLKLLDTFWKSPLCAQKYSLVQRVLPNFSLGEPIHQPSIRTQLCIISKSSASNMFVYEWVFGFFSPAQILQWAALYYHIIILQIIIRRFKLFSAFIIVLNTFTLWLV